MNDEKVLVHYFHGYNNAIINSIAAILQTTEYDSVKVREIKAILSVADETELRSDLFKFTDEESK